MNGQDSRLSVTRRYVAIIQDPRGYPPPGELAPAPPDGPAQVMVFSVVKADEHDDAIRGAVADFERVGKLAEWLIRDRREFDKVTAYARELEALARRHGGQ